MLRSDPSREWVPTGAIPLRVQEVCLPRFSWHWHMHPELELTLILAGSGRRLVGDTVELFGPGDCVLLGPDVPHTWVSGRHEGQARALVLHFGIDCAGPAVRPALQALARRAAGGLHIVGSLQAEVATGLPALVRVRHPVGCLGRALALLACLMEGSAEPIDRGGATARAGDDPVLGRALRHVRDHLDQSLTQAGCARLAGLSPAAFARACRRRLGATFRDHVTELRLARACRLLASGDEGISQIALVAGFANLANFNRRFRARLGMTPSTYRLRTRGDS